MNSKKYSIWFLTVSLVIIVLLPECIRCGRCKKVCPTDAIQCGIRKTPDRL